MFLRRNFKSDRRRSARQLLNTSVRVCTDDASIDAIGINISEHGMRLFTVANLGIDSQIHLEFLPAWSSERIRVLGTIRNRALYLYGIEFSHDSAQMLSPWNTATTMTDEASSEHNNGGPGRSISA